MSNTNQADNLVTSVAALGKTIREVRKQQGLTQADISGLAAIGNRFVVDLEKGKPTIQLQKTLDVLALLGLELVIRKKYAKRDSHDARTGRAFNNVLHRWPTIRFNRRSINATCCAGYFSIYSLAITTVMPKTWPCWPRRRACG